MRCNPCRKPGGVSVAEWRCVWTQTLTSGCCTRRRRTRRRSRCFDCATAAVPTVVATQARACALGGNPAYTGAPEFLAADFADLLIRNRASSDEEIAALKHP